VCWFGFGGTKPLPERHGRCLLQRPPTVRSIRSLYIQTKTVAAGRHYRLTVKPGPSAPEAGARCLQIQTDSADPRDRIVAVFLRAGNGDGDPTSEDAEHKDLAPGAADAPEAR